MDWAAVGAQAVNLLLGVFGTALATLLVIAVKKLAEKWHIEIGEAQEAALESAADKAVHAAEEWARKQSDKPTGNAKMDFAMGVVKDVLGSSTYQKFAEPKIKAVIDSTLNEKRQSGQIPDPPKPNDTAVIPAPVAADLGVK